MKNISLIKKFIFSTGCIIIVNILLSLGTLFTLKDIQNRTSYLQGNVLKQAQSATKLKLATVQVQQWLTDISATRGAEGFDDGFKEAEDWAKQFKEEMTFLKANVKDPKVITQLGELETFFDDYYNMGKQMAAVYIKDGPAEGNKFMEKFDPFAAKITDKLEEINLALTTPIQSKFDEIFEVVTLSEKVFLALAFIAFAGSSLFVYIIVKSIKLEMNSILERLKNSSQSVFKESGDLSHLAEQLSQATTEQASALQETSSAIEEINSMILATAENAKQSAVESNSSLSNTDKGKVSLNKMLAAIDEINACNTEIMNQINTNSKEIEDIVVIINQIGSKTKIINDIVFQTKLLSFNASVEAARAGEQGKGFSVVAEEVGNLASMSGAAALEISQLLDNSIKTVESIAQNSKKTINTLVENSKAKIEIGAHVARECEKSFDEIITSNTNVSTLVTSISSSTQEQSIGVREITVAITQLDQVTQQNSSSSANSSTAARILSTQAGELNSLIHTLGIVVNGQGSNIETPERNVVKSKVVTALKSPIKNEFKNEFKKEVKKEVKKDTGPKLEIVKTPIPAVVEKKLHSNELPSSNDSRFEDV